jgi:hypothetical protein
MIGGLLNSASRTALVAAAGLFVGGVAMPSAKAADLGGDCCADLEERVAELEATTARKGNRKMSVTITGQVNKFVQWWDDGLQSKTYYGLENRNSSTRFSILGEAKVTPNVKMGFEIMLDNQAGSSSTTNQWESFGRTSSTLTNTIGNTWDGNNNDSYFGAARRMIFWVEDAKLGRISVGHYEMAGAVPTIDLGGISAGASSSLTLVNGGFFLRGPAGQYYAASWSNFVDPAATQSRQNEVRYDSAVYMGFILSGSVADDGSNYGTMLRYAGEASGFRIAAGIGYEHYGQVAAQQNCTLTGTTCTLNAPGFGPANQANPAPNVNAWGAALSLLHVPTGLFVQGHYEAVDFDENAPTTPGPGNSWWAQSGSGRIPADQWLIQGGITKNWFGFGNTALFAEYSREQGWGGTGGPFAASGRTFANNSGGVTTVPGAQTVFGVTDTAVTMYGFGITQNVDAAATEIYLDYRHFSADITCSATGANCTGAAAPIGTVTLQKLQTEDFWTVIGGARLKF